MYFAKQYITMSMICIHFLLFQSIRSLTSYAPVTFGWTICLLLDCTQLPASLLLSCHHSPVALHSVFLPRVLKRSLFHSAGTGFSHIFQKYCAMLGVLEQLPFYQIFSSSNTLLTVRYVTLLCMRDIKAQCCYNNDNTNDPPAKISRSSWPCLN